MIAKEDFCERFIPKGFDAKFSLNFEDIKPDKPYSYMIHILPSKRTALVNIVPLVYGGASDVVSTLTYRNRLPLYMGLIFPEFLNFTGNRSDPEAIGISVIYNILPQKETIALLALRSMSSSLSGISYLYLR
jgi:hypothetical protein